MSWSSIETSAIWVVTRRPCGSFSTSHSRLVSAIASADTSHIATLQPSATSCRASSRPMPVPPPVMTAIFPAKSFMGTDDLSVSSRLCSSLASLKARRKAPARLDRDPRRMLAQLSVERQGWLETSLNQTQRDDHDQGRWRYIRNIGMTRDLAVRIGHLQRDGYLDRARVSEGVSPNCKR